ncbi:MAG: flagellar motor switch protein FliN [bacterium]
MSEKDKKNGEQKRTEEQAAAEWEKMMEGISSDKDENGKETETSKEKESANNSGGEEPGSFAEKQKEISLTSDSMNLKDSVQDTKKSTTESPNIDFLLDIPLEVYAELGRSKMIIYDLLQLSQGSVIELDKLAGEPLDLCVNKKRIARGEAVVMNEKFGIRITEISSPHERIEQLNSDERDD